MSFWTGRRILVTGGSGFVGSHLVERLTEEGARLRVIGRSAKRYQGMLGPVAARTEFMEGDLGDPAVGNAACRDQEMVFHLAAHVGGVGYNSAHPGTLLYENARVGLNVLDAAAKLGLERALLTSSACVYRGNSSVPTPENEGFLDDPEITNLGYGWSKRLLEVQARCYASQFPIKIALPRPYNSYGPRDDFAVETSHVIPSLIRKVMAGDDPIEVWGDGTQTRSFLYVSDFVEGLLRTMELHAECDPINIGSDEEVTVGDLVHLIVKLCGSRARVRFDPSRPSGQARRIGDYSRARSLLGFAAKVPLAVGLERTIEWYRSSGRT
jgi:GDP-L-fucose synthase